MSESFAYAAVAVPWAACAFAALQWWSSGSRRGTIALSIAVAVGLVAMSMRTGGTDFGWVRSYRLRSDALAIGALVPTVALLLGAVASRTLRRGWVQGALTGAGLACAVAGFAAVAIGRTGWYWEFVAIVGAGITLLVAGACGATDRTVSGDRRVVLGTLAAFGGFLVVAGGFLLTAWRALA